MPVKSRFIVPVNMDDKLAVRRLLIDITSSLDLIETSLKYAKKLPQSATLEDVISHLNTRGTK